MTHPELEQLNDLVDGRLAPAARHDVEAHLASCRACRDEVDALRATVAAAAALPSSLPVPDGLWDDVRATIDARRVVALPRAPRAARTFSTRTLAIAATALVMASSGLTAFVLRGRGSSPAPVEAVALLPASWRATESGYIESVDALRAQLDAQRAQLDTATIAAVERALATIDAAIVEARAALERDPANAALTDLLASNYRQKVELLRRATQLASIT